LGIGHCGFGIGDWAQSPIPNPQSPIPNPHLQNIKKTKNISKNVLFKKSIRKSLFILLLLCLIYLIINYSSKISFTNKRNSTTTKEEFINKTEKELENINKNQTLIKDESKIN
jgi:hypothetical protein